MTKKEKPWNRCDICGRFIALSDFIDNKASRRLTDVDTSFSSESYETLCENHNTNKKPPKVKGVQEI